MLPNNLIGTVKAIGSYLFEALLVLLVLVLTFWAWHCAPDWLKTAEDVHRETQEWQGKVASLEQKIAGVEIVQEPAWWKVWKWPAYWAQQSIIRELAEANERLALAGKELPSQFILILHLNRRPLAWALFVILLLPYMWRTVAYWLLMPLLGRNLPPSCLLDAESVGKVQLTNSSKPLQVTLQDHEKIFVQQGHVSQRSGVCIVDGVCWKIAAPLISSAAHLWWIIVLTKEPDVASGSVTLSTGDPDCYIAELQLEDHPGLVIRPSQIVAVSDGVGIQTRWRWGPHHWLGGHLRYVLFSGTGRLWVKAQGGAIAGGDKAVPSRLEPPLIVAFDGRARVAATRTQSFFSYLFGKSWLCDFEIGPGRLHLYQQSVPKNTDNTLQNGFTFILQSIGNLIGL